MNDTRFKIKYCSVDGDSGYSNRFNEHFNIILNDIINSDEDEALKKLKKYLIFKLEIFSTF